MKARMVDVILFSLAAMLLFAAMVSMGYAIFNHLNQQPHQVFIQITIGQPDELLIDLLIDNIDVSITVFSGALLIGSVLLAGLGRSFSSIRRSDSFEPVSDGYVAA